MTIRNDPDERLSELLRTPAPASQPKDEPSLTDRAEQVRDRVQEGAADVRDRVQEGAEQVRHRAEEAGHEAADRVDSAMTSTGDKLHDAARTLRERAPEGQVKEVAEGAARALERSGDYLRRADVDTVRSDLETIVREHPIEALAVGFGVGFLIARSMRPRRGYYG
jgi:ElaB/YqjD/DUF883 family membrane-anchored ribosome-binding protein